MVEIKKILVPTDFSDESIPAYTHAQEIAGIFNAQVDLLHVVPTFKYFTRSISKLGVPFDMEEDLYPHVKDGAEHKMGEVMEDYFKEENRGNAVVMINRKPSQVIADYASENHYDLVLMAAKGGHKSEMMKGSTTEKVVRHSSVPVFTIDNRLKAGSLQRILIPTDGSLTSFLCLPLALTLAIAYKSEIILYHVLELYGSAMENVGYDVEDPEEPDIYEAIIDRLNEFLMEDKMDNVLIRRGNSEFEDSLELTNGGPSKSVPLKTVIEKGVSAHYSIENYAPDHADLIVMTTHGHTGLAHFFLGSTTEKVVQHMGMPVITVKPGGMLSKGTRNVE